MSLTSIRRSPAGTASVWLDDATFVALEFGEAYVGYRSVLANAKGAGVDDVFGGCRSRYAGADFSVRLDRLAKQRNGHQLCRVECSGAGNGLGQLGDICRSEGERSGNIRGSERPAR